eukprot:m51a1_g624 hypothetical protein (1099) ;mRNA; f:127808-132268
MSWLVRKLVGDDSRQPPPGPDLPQALATLRTPTSTAAAAIEALIALGRAAGAGAVGSAAGGGFEGAAGAVAAAMGQHADNDTVQQAALEALAALATSGGPDASVALQQSGAISAAMAAMSAHPRSDGVQARGCRVIACVSLSGVPRAADELCKAGAAPAVVGALGIACAAESALVAAGSLSQVLGPDEEATADGSSRVSCSELARDMIDAVVAAAKASEFKGRQEYAVVQKEAAGVVSKAMSEWRDNTGVQEAGCAAIGCFLLNCSESVLSAASEQGSGLAVVAGMSANRSAATVQERGLVCLCRLSCCPSTATAHLSGSATAANTRQMLYDCGAVEATLRAMREHKQRLNVREWGLMLLSTLTDPTAIPEALRSSKNALWSEHGIDAVVTAMGQHKESIAVQANGCRVLCNIARSADVVPAFSKKAIKAVVAAMAAHLAVTTIQVCGCNALASAAVYNSSDVAAGGGVRAILASLVSHHKYTDVTVAAFLALGSIGKGCAQRHEIVKQEKGIEAVVKVLSDNSDSRDVVDAGTWSLYHLTAHPEMRSLLRKQGGIDVAVACMRAHEESVPIQEHCCSIIANMAADGSENQAEVIKKGGMDALVRVLRRHTADPALTVLACGAVAGLSVSQSGKSVAVKASAIEAVLSAAAQHKNSPDVLRSCFAAICAVVDGNAEAQQVARSSGAIKSLLECLAEFQDHAELAAVLLGVAEKLATRCAENVAALRAGGLVALAVGAMRAGDDAERDSKAACALYELLAADRACASEYTQLGVVDCLVHGLKAFGDNVAVQSRGIAVLYLLSKESPQLVAVYRACGVDAIVRRALRYHRVELDSCWRKVYDFVASGSVLSKYYAPLPAESYHMTLHPLFTEMELEYLTAYKFDPWLRQLGRSLADLRAVLARSPASLAGARVSSLHVGSAVLALEVLLPPGDLAAPSAVRALVANHTRVRTPDEYTYHVSLAYIFRVPTTRAEIPPLEAAVGRLDKLVSGCSLRLGPPTLCWFRDMTDFRPAGAGTSGGVVLFGKEYLPLATSSGVTEAAPVIDTRGGMLRARDVLALNPLVALGMVGAAFLMYRMLRRRGARSTRQAEDSGDDSKMV